MQLLRQRERHPNLEGCARSVNDIGLEMVAMKWKVEGAQLPL